MDVPILNPLDYNIAWIAPFPAEFRAAILLLDPIHAGNFPSRPGDDYVYQGGSINGHNVVVASLPYGQEYGNSSAAAIASQIKNTFRNLWFGLLVGLGTGFPKLGGPAPRDIRLGDVLVAARAGDRDALIPFDLGRETECGFELLYGGKYTARTCSILRSAISRIRALPGENMNLVLACYNELLQKDKKKEFQDPGQYRDVYVDYAPSGYNGTGENKKRTARPDDERVRVWYGPIASGDKLIRNPKKSDQLRDKYDVIGVDMEAAGTINRIEVAVIKGVCHYGNGMEFNEWEAYAAGMAAAYAKALLFTISPPSAARSPIETSMYISEYSQSEGSL